EVAELWRARELHRLAVRREAGARDWLTRWVSPRYELGHLGNHAVAQAEADLTSAAVDLERARARLLAAEAALTTPELKFDMRLLDQYEQAFSTESTSSSDWRQLESTAPNRSPSLLAARERASAQRTQASATGLRVLSPITGLVDVRPSRTSTDTETSEARRTTSSTERLLEFSVTVPFKPRELGSLIHAGARARLGSAQAERIASELVLTLKQLRSEADSRQSQLRAARERKRAAELAYAEVERRYRAAEELTALDDVRRMQLELFAADRELIQARAATLEIEAQFRSLTRGNQ
ncbi:MAG TPA: TolC family protein, partial [Polyangiaceae bacterium]|nr:TolC family protein [Polyangiaceae bacterium]